MVMQVSKIESVSGTVNVIKLYGAQGVPGASSKITFALGFTIPAGTTDATVTLSTSLVDGETVTGQVMGVAGTVRRDGSNYYFQRSAAGSSVVVPVGATFFILPPFLTLESFCEVVYSTSTTVADLVAIASGIATTDFLINRYNNKTYQYISGGWVEITPIAGMSVINKATGNCIKWSGSAWQSVATEINIQDWGIQGSRTTNATALNAIISAIPNFTGVQVFIPKGDYTFTATIAITDKYVRVYGEGRTITTLTFVDSNGFTVDSDAVTLEHFQISSTTEHTRTGIFISGGFCKLNNITFATEWFRALHCQALLLSSVQDCFFEKPEVENKEGTGIYSDYSVNIDVSRCKFRGWDKCIHFTSTLSGDGNGNEGWQIEQVTTLGNNSSIYADRIISLGVINCVLDINKDFGVFINNGNGLKVLGNWIAGPDPVLYPSADFTGVSILNAANCKVIGNQFYSNLSNSHSFGIGVGVTKSVIMGNICETQSFSNDAGTDNVVIGNFFPTGTVSATNAKTEVYGRIDIKNGSSQTARVVLDKVNQRWNMETGTSNALVLADLTNSAQKIVMEPTIGGRITLNCEKLKIFFLPIFADNAAAVAGGLVTNELYKTTTGEVRVVI